MHVHVEFCLVPIGAGTSLSPYIARGQELIRAAGLEHQLHAYGTNIAGDYDAVMAVVRECHEAVHAMGAPRIFTTLKIGSRTDREQRLQDKIDSVIDQLENPE